MDEDRDKGIKPERSVTISEARKRLGELVDQVADQGAEFIIARSGEPVAKIVPIAPVQKDFDEVMKRTVADSKDILKALE